MRLTTSRRHRGRIECVSKDKQAMWASSFSSCFSSGAIGGLIQYLSALLISALQIPAMKPFIVREDEDALFETVVIGGLWGFMFILRVGNCRGYLIQATAYGTVRATFRLLYHYPQHTPYGILGLGLSPYTPFYVLFLDILCWSCPAFAWFALLAHSGDEDDMSGGDVSRITSLGGPGSVSNLSNPLLV